MAYVDKLKSGNKYFYYLGKTIRLDKNKWKKIRIKLGNTPPSKEIIKKKLKELKLEQYKSVLHSVWENFDSKILSIEEKDIILLNSWMLFKNLAI